MKPRAWIGSSRCQTGLQKSKRFERNRIRIARLHAKVRDARQNLLHKATSALVTRHTLIHGEVTRQECHEDQRQVTCLCGADTLNREVNVSGRVDVQLDGIE